MRITLVAVNPSESLINEPEMLALMQRVEATCRYARGHVLNEADDTEVLAPPDECLVTAGSLRCTFLHVRSRRGRLSRQLTIAVAGARGLSDLPPPIVCAGIADMFGFHGMIFEDYEAQPVSCGGSTAGCASVAVICRQSLAMEN